MRIAFLAYDRAGYRGGPIVNARRLLPELQRRGHEVYALIFYHGTTPSAAYLESQGVRVHARAFPRFTQEGIDWILRTLAAIEPDVFVPNLSVAGWFAARWVREAGIPTIAAYRSGDAYHADMLEQFVLGDPAWAVSGLVCVSQGLHDRVAAAQPPRTQLSVIPSGVPLPAHQAQQIPGELRLAYVGRLVQEAKRIFDLIDALALVLNRLPATSAVLIGHGGSPADESAVDRHIARHGLGSRLRRLGAVEPEALADRLSQAHSVVLLSDYEGTPGAVMDGMACGLVPVCLDIPGGVRELVHHEHTGLLVANRGEAFVAAIERLAHDVALRQRLAVNARRHIEQGYSLSVAADRWEQLCQQLIDHAGPRKPIQRPWRYTLPPVRAGLAREDHRRPTIKRRIIRMIRSIQRHIMG